MKKLCLFIFLALLIFSCKKTGSSTTNAPSVDIPQENTDLHNTTMLSLNMGDYASSTNADGVYEIVVDADVDLDKITEGEFKIKTKGTKTTVKLSKYENGARWTIDVIAGDGNTTKTYTILIKKAPPNLSSEKGIKYIEIDNVVQSIASNPNDEFNFKVENVDISTYYNMLSENIKVYLKDSKASYEVTELTNDINNKRTYKIAVTAENTTKEDRYILTVERGLSDDANLDFIKTTIGEMVPTFDKNITEYTIDLLNNIDSFNNLSALSFEKQETFQYASSEVIIDNTIDLVKTKSKKVTFTVKAENGNTKVYTITVSVNKSSDTSIKSFVLSNFEGKLSPVFSQNTYTYKLDIGNASETAFKEITLTVTAVDQYTKVDVVYTVPILKDGKQTRDIIATVTAENGDKKTYTITVTRTVRN